MEKLDQLDQKISHLHEVFVLVIASELQTLNLGFKEKKPTTIDDVILRVHGGLITSSENGVKDMEVLLATVKKLKTWVSEDHNRATSDNSQEILEPTESRSEPECNHRGIDNNFVESENEI